MKINSIDDKTSAHVQRWMENGESGEQLGLGIDTQQDLQWLQKNQDISTITLNSMGKGTSVTGETILKGSGDGGGRGGGGGGGGATGLMALFGCAGRRK